MKKEINWLKIISLIGTGLGIIGSFVSDYATQKQTNDEIAKRVEEEVKKYFEEDSIA